MVKLYSIDKFDIPVVEDWTSDKDKNPLIVDTAGFIPLDVQIAKFEQSGVRAKYRSDMFDSQDMRDMYLGPNTRIFADDDIETINEKVAIQNKMKEDMMMRYYQAQKREAENQNSGISKPMASEAKPEGEEMAE